METRFAYTRVPSCKFCGKPVGLVPYKIIRIMPDTYKPSIRLTAFSTTHSIDALETAVRKAKLDVSDMELIMGIADDGKYSTQMTPLFFLDRATGHLVPARMEP